MRAALLLASATLAPAAAQALEITQLPGLRIGRAVHAVTPLPDGRFLVTGGFTAQPNPVAEAEIYEPAARAFRTIGSLITPRYGHTSTPLADGTVMLAGGWDASGSVLASAELFDPATGTFRTLPAMREARAAHVAVALADGRVLLTGGMGSRAQFLASAEIFDPRTGRFTPAAPMGAPRENHAAVRLADGRVLVCGGHVGRRAGRLIHDSAELFDPASNRFVPTGSLGSRRHKHDAVLMPDGRVLVTGGASRGDDPGATTEFYDPATGTFSPGPRLQRDRFKHFGTSVALDDGTVLILGGATVPERYLSDSNRFETLPGLRLADAESYAVAARSPDGSILLAGGYGAGIRGSASAWLIVPARRNSPAALSTD